MKNHSRPVRVLPEEPRVISREEMKETVAIINRKKDSRVAVNRREPIELNPGGAVTSVMNELMRQDVMKIAVGAFLEGRGLTGNWSLQLVRVMLVPVD